MNFAKKSHAHMCFRLGAVALAVSAMTLLGGCAPNDPINKAEKRDAAAGIKAPGFEQIREIAAEGFIYGLPIVMNYGVMYEFVLDKNSGQYKTSFNHVWNDEKTFTPQDTAIPTPNADTPYSMAWLDLRAEPVVISVPKIDPKRYYSVQLVDSSTFNYAYIGSRTTGHAGGDYLIAGPGWKGHKPAGIKQVFHAESEFSFAIFRTQLFNPADMPNVIKVQKGYKVQPLSAYLKQPAPKAPAAVAWPKFDKDLVKTEFFEYLDTALQFIPPGPGEEGIRAKLASIGVGPGKKFAFKDLSLEHKAAILLGMKDGNAKVDERVNSIGKKINGWEVGAAFGDRAFFNGDWLLRAAAARAGIYGNDAVEAMYPMTKWLADGSPLDGSKHAYTLTFAKGQLPPVNAFWSVTMYDGKSQLLVANPINRYLINSPMLSKMKKNTDGSLTLYIQKNSPGKDKEANWLPAPDGPIYMVMRLYWPKESKPSILPPGEGSWQPPALKLEKTL